MKFYSPLLRILGGLLFGSGAASGAETTWFADAIWYQVFPERFRNGDLGNDPVRTSLKDTWPYQIPVDWQPSPWTSDWYRLSIGMQVGIPFSYGGRQPPGPTVPGSDELSDSEGTPWSG